jgi:hypothetical protein
VGTLFTEWLATDNPASSLFHRAALFRFFNYRSAATHPCYFYLSIPFHAQHWLWIRFGLKAAVGQTITPTTDEANLFIRLGYQNIPVERFGRSGDTYTEYSKRVTHSLEALDKGSGTEVGEQKDADEWPPGHFSSEEGPLLLFYMYVLGKVKNLW